MVSVTKRRTPAGEAKRTKSDWKPQTISWRLPAGSLKPVSYTHLDVYKRQVE